MGEKPGCCEPDDLDGVLHFGQRSRASVEHVQHRGGDEARHQRRHDGEEAGKPRGAPGREQEPDGEGKVEGADVPGGMDRQAGVVSEEERRQRGNDHHARDDRERDTQRPLVRGMRSTVGPDGRQDRRRQVGDRRRAREPHLAMHRLGIARKGPARGAAFQVAGKVDGVDAEILAVEAGGDGRSRSVAMHAW